MGGVTRVVVDVAGSSICVDASVVVGYGCSVMGVVDVVVGGGGVVVVASCADGGVFGGVFGDVGIVICGIGVVEVVDVGVAVDVGVVGGGAHVDVLLWCLCFWRM